MKTFSRSLVAVACFAFATAFAADTFDVSTNRLTLGAVELNGTNYGNVVATVNSYTVLGVDGGVTNGVGSFNPTNSLLTLSSVTVQGSTYVNARVIINNYILQSVGVACTAPAMANSLGTCMSPPVANAIWNSVMKAWAYPAGVLVVGLNTLPAACVTIGDACWKAMIADGTIKLVSTNAAMTGYSTRPVVFAVYKTFDGYNNQVPLYTDVPALSTFANQLVFNGGGMQAVTDVKGSDNGIKITYPDYGCYERVHTGGGGWGNVKLGSCPI